MTSIVKILRKALEKSKKIDMSVYQSFLYQTEEKYTHRKNKERERIKETHLEGLDIT